jgi:NADH:ubiquinone oxidoreductase subunit 4 (subunit M)
VVDPVTIVAVVSGVAIVVGTGWSIYEARKAAAQQKRELSKAERWRQQDVEASEKATNMNLILALVGIGISILSIYLMYRGSDSNA